MPLQKLRNQLAAGLIITLKFLGLDTGATVNTFFDDIRKGALSAKDSVKTYWDTYIAGSNKATKALEAFRNAKGFNQVKTGLILLKDVMQDTGASAVKSASKWAVARAEIVKRTRALQKLIQTQREVQAAFTEYADAKNSNLKRGNLALENSSKIRQAFINERIAKYKTLGREINKVQKAAIDAELSKAFQSMEGKLKGRGYISRFLFGEGNFTYLGS